MPTARSTPARAPRRASPTITGPAIPSAVAAKPAGSTKAAPAPRTPDTVVVFDTETTGLHRGARLVEIAAIKFVNGREVERLDSLVDPGERIPHDATAVHGITTAMVRGKPRAAHILPDFYRFIDGAVLVAHFAAFDLRIINDELQRARLPLLKNAHVCTRNLARAHLNLYSYRLEDVARRLGVLKGVQEHRALGDVMLAAAVYKKLQERTRRTTNEAIPTSSRAAGRTVRTGSVRS